MDPRLASRCNQEFLVEHIKTRDAYGDPADVEQITIKGYLVEKVTKVVNNVGVEVVSAMQIIAPDKLDIAPRDLVHYKGHKWPIITEALYRKINGPPGTYESAVYYL